MFESRDSEYLNLLRGASVIRVMLVHLGLSWFYPPFSYYIGVFLPILFFVSGAVSFENYLRKPFGIYFTKRITGLWIPFFQLAVPVVLIFSARQLKADPASLVSWFLLWPDRSLFPFPIAQIWFINVLLLLVIISAPIFPFLYRSRTTWFAAGLACYCFLTLIFNSSDVVSVFSASQIVTALRLPKQLHQTFALAQFFFLGALYYKKPNQVPKIFLAVLCLITLLPGLYLSCLNSGCKNVPAAIDGRSANYILLAYAVIFALLLGRDMLLHLINRITLFKSLLLFASRNSYSLFLLHPLVLFLIERGLNMKNLSGNYLLAIIRLILVVSITMFLSIPYSALTRLISKYVSKIWVRG